MNLVYKPMNFDMPLESKQINQITIEDSRLYERMVTSIYWQINKQDEQWMLVQDGEELSMDKICDVLISPMDLRFEKKDIQKKLSVDLENEIQSDKNFEVFAELHGNMAQVIGDICERYRYQLEYDFDFCLKEYIKQYGIILADPEGTFLEKLLEYIPVVQDLTGKNIFVLTGCGDYLTDDDFRHLNKWLGYQECYIVITGNRQRLLKESLNEYIIDIDLCEIH
jgi:CRISPR type II-A-associated protein Csn2